MLWFAKYKIYCPVLYIYPYIRNVEEEMQSDPKLLSTFQKSSIKKKKKRAIV